MYVIRIQEFWRDQTDISAVTDIHIYVAVPVVTSGLAGIDKALSFAGVQRVLFIAYF